MFFVILGEHYEPQHEISNNVVCATSKASDLLELLLVGLENSTRLLVFTSVSGCRASEYFDISTEN